MHSDVKEGNFYEISNFRKDSVTKLSHSNDTSLSFVYFNLDTESKHYSSRVYNIMDSIGIIGGIFEILLSGILIIYTKIRHNLYFHSIISKCNKVRQQEKDSIDIFKVREFGNQVQDASSNEESKKINFENRRLLNH